MAATIATMEAEEHITDSTEEEEDMVDTVGELLKFIDSSPLSD